MWKLIILLTSVIAVQASIEDFLGVWTQTAYYPEGSQVPSCVKFSFNKAPNNAECTCDDGKTATLIEFGFLLEANKDNLSIPAIVVDSAHSVPLNINCTCGPDHYDSRIGLKSINENNFIMYEAEDKKTDDAIITAFMFAKNVPNRAELNAMIQNIDHLKNGKVGIMCTAEKLNSSEESSEKS